MSLNTLLSKCVRPLGNYPAGAAMEIFGLRPAALASAALVGVTSLVLLAVRPAVRRAGDSQCARPIVCDSRLFETN